MGSRRSRSKSRSRKLTRSGRPYKIVPYDTKHFSKGVARKKNNEGFTYYHIKSGKTVSASDQARINKLGIPPGWEDVWVSGSSSSAIQATGVDSKGRKQYRYHLHHVKAAECEKFLRMYDFVKAMPKLDNMVRRHSQLDPYDFRRVVASMLTVVKQLHIRVGKEIYARKNKSYGVSSLRKIHMKLEGDTVKFNFRGKSKKHVSYTLKHPTLAKHLKMLLKLEGNRLFQYIDDKDEVKPVSDRDLNHYIQEYIGNQFTIKDFRSAASNHYFIKALLRETKKRAPSTKTAIKHNIVEALNHTSHYLRHTKAISKKSYVLSLAIDIYQEDPQFFVKRKNKDPDAVLMEILRLYRKKMLKK